MLRDPLTPFMIVDLSGQLKHAVSHCPTGTLHLQRVERTSVRRTHKGAAGGSALKTLQPELYADAHTGMAWSDR